MDEATPTKTTMRQLLARWAEVEPGRCKREDWPNGERILILTPYGWQLVMDDEEPATFYPDKPRAEMYIQFVVQQAIVARGWVYNLEWDGEWYVWINDKWTGQDLENPTKAILEAYVAALESSK